MARTCAALDCGESAVILGLCEEHHKRQEAIGRGEYRRRGVDDKGRACRTCGAGLTERARKDLCPDCRRKEAQRRFNARKGKAAGAKPAPAPAVKAEGLNTEALEEALEMAERLSADWSMTPAKKARLVSALYSVRKD